MFLQNQHGPKNQGRCGVCGEEYSDPNKKLEPGPTNKFATGLITGNYQQGETSIYTLLFNALTLAGVETDMWMKSTFASVQ